MTLADLLQSSPALFSGLIFILGLLVGSFLNVVIHRLPLMMEREWRKQCAELATADVSKEAGRSGAAAPVPAAAPEPKFNLVVPRSACPACQAPIRAWQNIPLVSYACCAASAPRAARASPRAIRSSSS